LSYVHKRYATFAANTPELSEVSLVAGTCYRKLVFESDDQRHRLELYLAPDLRFLSRDLADSSTDPTKVGGDIPAPLLSQGQFPVLGPANAQATLTVFSDFECPFCARFQAMFKQSILPAEKGHVRLVFRFLPLPMHPWARAAAEATACAQDQKDDYFWGLHDYIFEHQGQLNPGNLAEKLTAVAGEFPGLDQARFQGCLSGRKMASRVERDVAFAAEYGIEATPTLFVNGHRLDRVAGAEQVLTLIRQLAQPTGPVAEAARW